MTLYTPSFGAQSSRWLLFVLSNRSSEFVHECLSVSVCVRVWSVVCCGFKLNGSFPSRVVMDD